MCIKIAWKENWSAKSVVNLLGLTLKRQQIWQKHAQEIKSGNIYWKCWRLLIWAKNQYFFIMDVKDRVNIMTTRFIARLRVHSWSTLVMFSKYQRDMVCSYLEQSPPTRTVGLCNVQLKFGWKRKFCALLQLFIMKFCQTFTCDEITWSESTNQRARIYQN